MVRQMHPPLLFMVWGVPLEPERLVAEFNWETGSMRKAAPALARLTR